MWRGWTTAGSRAARTAPGSCSSRCARRAVAALPPSCLPHACARSLQSARLPALACHQPARLCPAVLTSGDLTLCTRATHPPRPPIVQAPTTAVEFYAGIDHSEVEAMGPGALLVLALPAWHGWLYTSVARRERARERAGGCSPAAGCGFCGGGLGRCCCRSMLAAPLASRLQADPWAPPAPFLQPRRGQAIRPGLSTGPAHGALAAGAAG